MKNCENCGSVEFHELENARKCQYCGTVYPKNEPVETYMSDEYMKYRGFIAVPYEDKNKVPGWVWLIFIILPIIAPILFLF